MRVSENLRRMLGLDMQAQGHVQSYVQRINASLAKHAGFAVALVQVLLLVNAFAHKGSYDLMTNRMNRNHAITYLVFCLASVVLSLIAWRATKRNRVHDVVVPLGLYLALAVVYGIYNSWMDSLYGEPPLSFIFCMVPSSCVFVLPPLASISLNTCAFIAFYALSHFGESFAPNTILHYWLGWFIVTFVSVLRYQECRGGARHESELLDASGLDELTGLRNRRSLRADFPSFVGRQLFVAMCDLDDFKGINDTYGHAMGDLVLKAFSDGVRQAFPDDGCYRYGGDELLVFSACQSRDEFLGRVERARTAFAQNAEAIRELRSGPTMSVGYSCGRADTGEELRAMVHVADSSLYKVKRGQKGGTVGEQFQGAA